MSATSKDPSEIEQRLRKQVAAVTLLLNDEDIIGYSGHITTLLPGRDEFLIQPIDQSRAALEPEQLLVCGLDGKARGATNQRRPPSEVFIHSEIYRVRPDVKAVAHFHHDLTTTFSLVEDIPLRPVKNHAVRWESGIPTHPDPSHVSTAALGRNVAATLGPHHCLLIRAHGEVIVAESLPALLVDCVHFVENAVALYRAATLGKVKPLTEAEMDAFRHDFIRDRHVDKLWQYYVGRGFARGLYPQSWEPALMQ